jgi:hypothetical protein
MHGVLSRLAGWVGFNKGAVGKRGMPLLLASIAIAVGAADQVRGLTIDPTFASSITSLPNVAQWESALNYAMEQFETDFTDPITINIIFQANSGTGIFGQSSANGQFVGGYSTLKSLLASDAKSANDAIAVANLPATDPTNGADFLLITAQAKALGVLAANNAANDGTVTIGSGYNWTFDPNNRAVAGEYDFIGLAEHEISEVMGRYGTANFGGNFGLLDLFGYAFGAGGTGTGTLDLAANQANNYFCIDGGKTALKLYNDHANGEDDKDWGSGSNDAFNAFSSSGVENNMSALDIEEMDVIGYDVAVPEPASVGMLAVCGLALVRRRRQEFNSLDHSGRNSLP